MKSVLIDPEYQDKCWVCGSDIIAWHHVFEGTANRKISDKLGYVIPLCHKHHNGSNEAIHFNKPLDLMVKRMAQRHFEREHSREEFIKLIGRSYL